MKSKARLELRRRLTTELIKLSRSGDEKRIFVAYEWEKILAEARKRDVVEVPVYILAGLVKSFLMGLAVMKSWNQVFRFEKDKRRETGTLARDRRRIDTGK